MLGLFFFKLNILVNINIWISHIIRHLTIKLTVSWQVCLPTQIGFTHFCKHIHWLTLVLQLYITKKLTSKSTVQTTWWVSASHRDTELSNDALMNWVRWGWTANACTSSLWLWISENKEIHWYKTQLNHKEDACKLRKRPGGSMAQCGRVQVPVRP